MKSLIFISLIVGVFTRSYPLYKQCNAAWKDDKIGTSSHTICYAGCIISSAAMALAGNGHNYNPKTLN
jgi:hypothetical protein